MPSLPQFPIYNVSKIVDFQKWVLGYLTALQRQWTSMVFTINALSKNDTAANRPATPEQDEIFFTETDSGQTYVGVAGAWVSLGDQRDVQAFTFFMS